MQRFPTILILLGFLVGGIPSILAAETRVTLQASNSTQTFEGNSILPPAINDSGAHAQWKVLFGQVDRNAGPLNTIFDGSIPEDADQPQKNFFFAGGTKRAMLAADLGEPVGVREMTTYSWHPGVRALQVYTAYAAEGSEPNFAFPQSVEEDPQARGWKKLATVDTRTQSRQGGQHAARIDNPGATLGHFRHLLWVIEPSKSNDPFGQTFFSEIDVITDRDKTVERIPPTATQSIQFATEDGRYHFTLDTTKAPMLSAWAEEKLKPVIIEWYPKVVSMLPSPDYTAADHVRFEFQPDTKMKGTPAYASGSTITLNTDWFRRELDREARGAVVHEMVHVVQRYPGRSRASLGVVAPPGWIVEGIPDYIRWFLYEPQTRGAILSKRALAKAKHDASYRTSANFIDWVIREKDRDGKLLEKLNAAARQGTYRSELWKELTGSTEEELAQAWRERQDAP